MNNKRLALFLFAIVAIALIITIAVLTKGQISKIETLVRLPATLEIALAKKSDITYIKAYYDVGNDINEADTAYDELIPHSPTDTNLTRGDALSRWNGRLLTTLSIPLPPRAISYVRLDTDPNRTLKILEICLKSWLNSHCWSADILNSRFRPLNDIRLGFYEDQSFVIQTQGADPYFSFDLDIEKNHTLVTRPDVQLIILGTLAFIGVIILIIGVYVRAIHSRILSLIRSPRLLNRSWIVLLLLFFAGLAYLKITGLENWFYSSDMFTYDQLMQQTLNGYFGLEYTYGNQFGDHTYYIFLLLLPVKLLLGKYMIYFLALLSILVHCLCVFLSYRIIRKYASPLISACTGLMLLLGYRSIEIFIEATYGLHPDTLAGPLATLFAFYFYHYLKAEQSTSNQGSFYPGLFALLLFALVKEEFLLLAIGFSLVMTILTQRLTFLLTTIGLTVFGAATFWFIKQNQTIFNRGNDGLIDNLYTPFQDNTLIDGVIELVSYYPDHYLITIGIFAGLTLLLWLLGRSLPKVSIGLWAMAFAKTLAAAMIDDYKFITWHNSPILFFLICAIVLQLVDIEYRRQRKKALQNLASAALANHAFGSRSLSLSLTLAFTSLSIGLFCASQITVFKSQYLEIQSTHIDHLKADIAKLKPLVDKNKVVSLTSYPHQTVLEWTDGYRFAFFPRGVYGYPEGIASYIVLRKDQLDDPNIQDCYQVTHEADYYVLLEQRTPCMEINPSHARNAFIQLFGPGSIGL